MKHARVSERCLQLWIQRYNDGGIDAISYKPKTGRPRLLEKETVEQQILPVVLDPKSVQENHWTATKLCGWLKQNKSLELSYSTLVRYLHEHKMVRRIPRPMPEPRDEEKWIEEREYFCSSLLDWMEDANVELFFGDEAGFEGDPRPRQKWVKRGSHPTQPYYGGHIRQNVVGAVSPSTGQLVSLIVPHNDTEVFQAFLDTMAAEVPEREGKQVYLILDNASWHKSTSLNWRHIVPKFLPAYSPDFNPIERLWQHLKSHYLAGYITKDRNELCDKLYESLANLIKSPETLKSVCNLTSG